MDTTYKPISLGDWIVTFILLAIPVVNIVMLFVWALSGGTHPSKKTYAQASLILALVGIVLWFLFSATLISGLTNLSNQRVQ
jgi:Na+/melibiose symporter-like transporter